MYKVILVLPGFETNVEHYSIPLTFLQCNGSILVFTSHCFLTC